MKKRIEDYRTRIFGALLDEHDKPFEEFIQIVETISESDFQKIVDKDTTDENCKSIQSICTHVVGLGYGYISLMRKTKKLYQNEDYTIDDRTIDSISLIIDLPEQIKKMMAYMIHTLNLFKEFEEEPWTVFVTTRSGSQIDFEVTFKLKLSFF